MFYERLGYWSGALRRSDVGRLSGRRPAAWTDRDWYEDAREKRRPRSSIGDGKHDAAHESAMSGKSRVS